MSDKPWDQRLANILVRPLVATPVHPNHLTGLSLFAGIVSAALFAAGETALFGWAAFAYMLAVFLDHTDGELARMAGKTSEFGHRMDYLVGSANYTLLFCGIGIGLAQGDMGASALWLGLGAGFANPIIVTLRMKLEDKHGAEAVEHPTAGGFEIEDFIYLIGPITWLGGLTYFFLVYGLGTLGYLVWTIWEFARPRRG